MVKSSTFQFSSLGRDVGGRRERRRKCARGCLVCYTDVLFVVQNRLSVSSNITNPPSLQCCGNAIPPGVTFPRVSPDKLLFILKDPVPIASLKPFLPLLLSPVQALHADLFSGPHLHHCHRNLPQLLFSQLSFPLDLECSKSWVVISHIHCRSPWSTIVPLIAVLIQRLWVNEIMQALEERDTEKHKNLPHSTCTPRK